MDTSNKVLFLQQELDAARQENKFLKDTIAIKNQQRHGGVDLLEGHGRDLIELENALQAANHTIDELRGKLSIEEAKQVRVANQEKGQRSVHEGEDREGETEGRHRPRELLRPQQQPVAHRWPPQPRNIPVIPSSAAISCPTIFKG